MLLKYKENARYSHISTIKSRAFLDSSEFNTIKESPIAFAFFIFYKISLLAIYICAVIIHIPIPLIVFSVLLGLVFNSVIDRELLHYASKRLATSTANIVIQKLHTEQADGWYDDPWAFGVPHQQRLWHNGDWQGETRIVSPDLVKSSIS
jgi:hypothetical protein